MRWGWNHAKQLAAIGPMSPEAQRFGSFGDGSVSAAALAECQAHGITPIVGGCPLMFCGKVDIVHRCFRWWLGKTGRVPV